MLRGVTLLGNYEGSRCRILHRCEVCKHEWLISPTKLKEPRVSGFCPNCRVNSRTKGITAYKAQVLELVGEEYLVLGDTYINNHTHILHKHVSCGHEWGITPKSFIGGNRCPKCFGHIKLTNEEYKDRVNSLNNGIKVLGSYVNIYTSILHKHLVCGHEWMASPNNILSNKSNCPKCFGNLPLTPQQYSERLIGSQYSPLEDYVTSALPILHRCNTCGAQFKAAPNDVYRGNWGCPKCSKKFDKTKPTLLYYVVFDELWYKIGVTNFSVKERFKQDRNLDIKVLHEFKFSTGEEALTYELALKRKYKEVLDNAPPNMLHSGNTEVANEDFLTEEDIKWLNHLKE